MNDTNSNSRTANSEQKILVIEDDFAIRNSVEFALRREGYQVKSLDSGSDATQAVEEFSPDLILVDVMLPGKTGHQITEELRNTDLSVAIIMISALGEADDRIAGLRLGADDYVCKPFSLDELLERVRANLRRSQKGQMAQTTTSTNEQDQTANSATDAEVLRYGSDALVIDPKKHEARIYGEAISLRAKEFALLHLLARKPDEVLSRDYLSNEIWGQDHLQSSRTIDVHMTRLRALLAENKAPKYLRTVHGVGYRFDSAAVIEDPDNA